MNDLRMSSMSRMTQRHTCNCVIWRLRSDTHRKAFVIPLARSTDIPEVSAEQWTPAPMAVILRARRWCNSLVSASTIRLDVLKFRTMGIWYDQGMELFGYYIGSFDQASRKGEAWITSPLHIPKIDRSWFQWCSDNGSPESYSVGELLESVNITNWHILRGAPDATI
jgi:hypothetical protein